MLYAKLYVRSFSNRQTVQWVPNALKFGFLASPQPRLAVEVLHLYSLLKTEVLDVYAT